MSVCEIDERRFVTTHTHINRGCRFKRNPRPILGTQIANPLVVPKCAANTGADQSREVDENVAHDYAKHVARICRHDVKILDVP